MTDNEHEQGRGRAGESTTMRLPGIGAPVEPVVDADISLSASNQATVDALRRGTALLVVLRGPNTGARFLLDSDQVSSGRHPDSDIFLDDVTVSRKHATFRSRCRLPERHLRQPDADRRGHPQDRRRGPDRQVPARVLCRCRPVTTCRERDA
jgi:hypothetical protein